MQQHAKPFPVQILKSHVAVLGKTGSGKTSTAKLLIEQIVDAGDRVCIIDPIKSDHWGLVSSADGKHAGLPFQILGGPNGHVPLHDGAGAAIGELVGTGALPLSILDMADFKAGGHNRFFNAFVEKLMRKMRGVLYLVIEECHEFAPKERSGLGEENMAIYYAKKLATAGRSKGVRLIVCSQSVQQLHNRVLGSCETLIVHRFTAPADQEPVLKWLKGNIPDKIEQDAVRTSLRNLADGEAWMCSSGLALERRQFPRIRTFDNSKTPERGDAEHSVITAKIDEAALRTLVGAAVDEAEANDPVKLKAKLVKVEKELAAEKAKKPAIVPAKETRVEVPVISREVGEHLLAAAAKLATSTSDLTELSKVIGAAVMKLEGHNRQPARLVNDGSGLRPRAPLPATQHRPAAQRPAPRASTAATPAENNERDLGKGEILVLTAVAQHSNGCTREQLTVITGYKRSSRDTYLQRLGAASFTEQNGDGRVRVTQEGIDFLGANFQPLPTGTALQEKMLNQLPAGESEILKHLIAAHPESVTRDQLSELTDYKRSSRDTYLQRLGARELVVSDNAGVRASDNLFD